MIHDTEHKPWLARLLPVLMATACIVLVVFVGQAETNKRHIGLTCQRLAAACGQLESAVIAHVDAGAPLSNFAAFDALIKQMDDTALGLAGIAIVDQNGHQIEHLQTIDLTQLGQWQPMPKRWQIDNASMSSNDDYYRISRSLDSKFGHIGTIHALTDRHLVDDEAALAFSPAILTAIIAIAAMVILFQVLPTQTQAWARLSILSGGLVIVGGVGLWCSILLYQHDIDRTTASLSHQLAHRLSLIESVGLSHADIRNLPGTISDWVEQDPRLAGVSLLESQKVLIQVGRPADHENNLSANVGPSTSIQVVMDTTYLWQPVTVAIRSYMVLLIACGLLGMMILEAGQALERTGLKRSLTGLDFSIGLNLIRPAYFLIIVINCLSVAFLPQLVYQLAKDSQIPTSLASLPFTGYYIAFAAAMIPAGKWVRDSNLRGMMAIGCLCECVGLSLIAWTSDFWLITLARIISGAGQGVFLIGLQSYLLAITPVDKRTSGNAIKVIAKNAGSISGATIGALLIAYIDYHAIFLIAAITSILIMLYVTTMVPRVDQVSSTTRASIKKPGKSNLIGQAVRDGEFLKTLTLIGLSSKMTITGVVMFATPLLLEQAGFLSETIGQTLMLYYILAMIATQVVARRVDKKNATKSTLVWSAAIAAMGMLLLGCCSDHSDSTLGVVRLWLVSHLGLDMVVALIVTGLALTGISFGMSAAPLLTHISKTALARNTDTKQATATYTLLERSGHVLGPLVVSQLYIFLPLGTAIAVFGLITLLLGCAFMFQSHGDEPACVAS